MNDAFVVSLLSVVPKHPTARFMGWNARLRLPAPLQRALLRWYVKAYKVDLTECEGSIEDYASLAEFFVRPLRPGVRPVDPDPDVLVSPVDARVHTFGRIEQGGFFQADGKKASIAELIGAGDPRCPAIGPQFAEKFEGGGFAVLYLSPRDYHRVHMPITGTLRSMTYIPGKLFSVNTTTAENVRSLFARNERAVCIFDTEAGPMAMILVGAMIVAGIETVWAGQVAPPPREITTRQYQETEAAPVLQKGEEMGRFKLGSTVILLFGKDQVDWLEQYEALTPTRLGEALARRR